ncbi:MAG TPA: VOC family protein [Candidatus Saccharimonadales bacterium]|nr:VOC family protein [Candidatus Saccharimonadales bacterium]
MKKTPVVHFEMPYEDSKRVAEFYAKAFGWNMQMMGGDYKDYVLAVTTESNEGNGRPKDPGAINGGFFKKDDENNVTSVVISVEDMESAIGDIEAAGGKILRQPSEIPGIGMWAVFTDSEGNRVSILKPSPMDMKK